jgi:hypothetical protein
LRGGEGRGEHYEEGAEDRKEGGEDIKRAEGQDQKELQRD